MSQANYIWSQRVLLGAWLVAAPLLAQTSQQQPTPQAVPPASGKQPQVLFERHGDSPEPDSDRKPLVADEAVPEVTAAQRTAIAVRSYDLDVHVVPATGDFAVHGRIVVRNRSLAPLTLLPLQVSSSLHWDSVAILTAAGQLVPLKLVQHRLETDADHTGFASEAVLTLEHPLAPDATLELDVLYSGTVAANATRLERIGASKEQAAGTDWDSIDVDTVALRGFGNVLWYPVVSPALFLGDGNNLFAAVGHAKFAGTTTPVRLRLALEYSSDAPAVAYFAGKPATFQLLSNNAADHDARSGGVAVAEWKLPAAGFRTLNLFVFSSKPLTLVRAVDQKASAQFSSSSEAESESGAPLVDVLGVEAKVAPKLAVMARSQVPLLNEWLGPKPIMPLTLVEEHTQPFEDGALLVGPANSFAVSGSEPMLAYSLTRAWVQTGDAWIDEGLAQFFALLSIERERGRDDAIAEMNTLLRPLPIGEPAFTSAADVEKASPGQPLIAATEEVFYRRKAAAVWWMLRELAGQEALSAALGSLRTLPANTDARARALAFENKLEAVSHKDFGWFFHDWVLNDLGLPDLTLVDVTPRPLPAGKGHDTGWLVAVTVRNDGAATADVPLTIRSGSATSTRRLRIAGFTTVTERVLVHTEPSEVLLNDGSTPEVRTSFHSRQLHLTTQ
ncbi:MAG: hypothetical protein PW792_01560 [Acidobacteriaceae bacterium]|nr:hypothetical protein [Acidobacteriaceae bacterium]